LPCLACHSLCVSAKTTMNNWWVYFVYSLTVGMLHRIVIACVHAAYTYLSQVKVHRVGSSAYRTGKNIKHETQVKTAGTMQFD
jgi:hypothetical protein